MNFTDEWGRVHQKPVTEEKPFPGNNGFIYTGYALLAGLIISVDKVLSCWAKCATEYGYNRHPNGDKDPACSHDEVVGLFMLLKDSPHLASWYYRKYEDQGFQICNLDGFEPKAWWTLNPFKVIRDFYKLSQEKDENGNSNSRRTTYKYPYIWPIVFWHWPQHTYFYKRCAGEKPGLFHTLWFLFSSMSTMESEGTKIMLGFKLVRLKQLGLNWAEKIVVNVFDDTVDLTKEVEEYFEPYTEEHPIVQQMRLVNGKP